MSEVELRIAADPALVRTARQVAVALGRRVDLDDEALDEVRLAVGEAAGLAVALAAHPDGPGHRDRSVVVRYVDEGGLLVHVGAAGELPPARGVAAADVVGAALAAPSDRHDGHAPALSGGDLTAAADVDLDASGDALTPGATIMVLSTLAPSADVSTGPAGLAIRLHWPR